MSAASKNKLSFRTLAGVNLYNQTDEAEAIEEQNYEFEFDLRELGIGGKAEVRDLWRQQDLGTCTGTLRALVPYHGVSLVRIPPVE